MISTKRLRSIYSYADDYWDDLLADSEPYATLKPTECAQIESEDEQQEDVYNVEKILNKKKEGRRCLYLVKWEGFEEKDATWEPLSNLGNVKELVKEYDKAHDIQVNSN